MDNSYKAVADYFTFDSNEYQMGELFSDLRKFMSLFSQAMEADLEIKINQRNQKHVGKENSKTLSYPASKNTNRKLLPRNAMIN